jgi:hypothetical protein
MSGFGETLFGGSRFIRWSLSPFVLLFAVFIPIAIEQWTPARVALITGMEFMCIALLAGFWLPVRLARWAFRGLAGAVFLSYISYLIYEFFFSNEPFRVFGNRGEASPRNALLGFVIIGLPSLWYALLGRFSLSAPEEVIRADEPEGKPEEDDE